MIKVSQPFVTVVALSDANDNDNDNDDDDNNVDEVKDDGQRQARQVPVPRRPFITKARSNNGGSNGGVDGVGGFGGGDGRGGDVGVKSQER
uniref:Uncharacterized protein n=1 Tax=Vespula pensylvanica TaxID=30213 RepID=A0A834UHJ4_VESPE|nr:hypothetical protein H0235_001655 [Vespula pensylvanica]